MRKLLLASAAMLGAAGIAQAQMPAGMTMTGMPTQGGIMGSSNGGRSGANTDQNTQVNPNTYQGQSWQKTGTPTPGTVIIRLNGRVQFQANAFFTSSNVSQASAAAAAKAGSITVAAAPVAGAASSVTAFTAPTAAVAAVPAGANKLNPVGFSSYVRLYPGIDGMATNGLRYGASVELRTNYYAGANSTSATFAAITPSGNSNLSTVFVRRNFVYLAADNIGLLRVGQTDGLGDLLDPGGFTQGGGAFDGGVGSFNGAMLEGIGPTGAVGLPYPWFRDAGADYDAVKIVYLSPQFFGFDVGVEYAPSMGDSSQQTQPFVTNGAASTCNQAGPSCIGLTTGTDGTRWFNKVAAGARWQGSFGPVDIGLYGIYTAASKESVFGGAVKGVSAFDNLSEYNVAGGITYNSPVGAIAVSANYVGGAGNGSAYTMRPTGGAPLSGLMTAITWKNGPIIVGAAGIMVNSQGSAGLTGISQRRESGVAVGASYLLAPGLTVAAEYMFLQRHQGNFNFGANAATGTVDARAQGFMVMTAVNW